MLFTTWLRNLHSARGPGRQERNRRRSPLLRGATRFQPRLEALEDRTVPSTLTVVNNLDSGAGSLRDTIAAASPSDTIVFDPSLDGQTITLTSNQLVINKNLDVEGPGADQLTISGNAASRIFDISGGATVTVAGLTIANGSVVDAGGGGIANESGATLTLSQDTFANNTALGIGGGLWNRDGGTVTVADCTFVGNQAIGFVGFFGPGNGTSEGGGIDNDGTGTVTNSTFTNNLAHGTGGGTSSGAHGGGIGDDGPLTVSGCTFTDNQALGAPVINGVTRSSQGLGGAILIEAATVTVSNSTFTGNLAQGGDGATSQPSPSAFTAAGGGIQAFTTPTGVRPNLTVSNSTFDHNQAIGGAGGPGGSGSIALGGGLEVNRASLTLSGSSFSHNAAIGGAGGSGAAGGDATGGGVSVDIHSTATISNITVSYNQALGGAGGAGANGGNGWGGGLSVASRMLLGNPADGTSVTLSGSTLTDNLALGGDGGTGGNGGNGSGGGVFLGTSGSLSVTGSTITDNHANGGSGSGGGTDGLGVGGGVYNLGTFTFDVFTVINNNHASTSNDDIFG